MDIMIGWYSEGPRFPGAKASVWKRNIEDIALERKWAIKAVQNYPLGLVVTSSESVTLDAWSEDVQNWIYREVRERYEHGVRGVDFTELPDWLLHGV